MAFVAAIGTYAKGLMTAATTQAATLGTITPAGNPTTPGAPPGADGALPPLDSPLWEAMTDDQLRAIGNRDGTPAAVRDRANRILLDRAIAANSAKRTAVQAELDALPKAPGHDAERLGLQSHLDALDRQGARLTDFRKALDTAADGTTPRPRLLLGFDPSGDGRFIVSRGDPDKAANVATFVPGAESGMDSAVLAMRRADSLYQAAVDAGSNDTAVITWLDYDSPDFAPAAPFNTWSSADAAPRLAEFQAGLRASHQGLPSHNSLVGHSYGAVVAGAATTGDHAAPVDEVVGAGAINMGAGAETAADIRVQPGHVWVIEHQEDYAADFQPDGQTDPSSARFGAKVYGAEPGPYEDSYRFPIVTRNVPAHGNYFDYGDPEHAAGLRRMGQIITRGSVDD